VGLPGAGRWREAINTDSRFYAGTDVGNGDGVVAERREWNGQPWSAELVLPPLATLWLVPGDAT
jgi:1,4-alpha-glucan branching enzyme